MNVGLYTLYLCQSIFTCMFIYNCGCTASVHVIDCCHVALILHDRISSFLVRLPYFLVFCGLDICRDISTVLSLTLFKYIHSHIHTRVHTKCTDTDTHTHTHTHTHDTQHTRPTHTHTHTHTHTNTAHTQVHLLQLQLFTSLSNDVN